MRYANRIILCVLFCFSPTMALAGNLDDPAAPTSADSAMYTLEDIYDRLDSNTQATKRSGAFTEPSAVPGSTGYTLDQVYEKAIPTQVPKTGQTEVNATGDDGDLEKGVSWPNPRFTDNSDGTVTDNLTGLIWLQDANCSGVRSWSDALNYCNNLADGDCSLSDNSEAGDWRLPNRFELESLLDLSQSDPAIPSGHPFTNVQSDFEDYYWSSTTDAVVTGYAWSVKLSDGSVNYDVKTFSDFVWPVRAGQ